VRAPFHVFSIDIPVDAVDLAVTNTEEISAMYTRPGAEIIGVTTDMKYLGQTLEASVVAPDGTATTLLDVQDWSEDARKDYMFDPDKYIPVASGSAIEHTCTYSNRLEDQRLDASGKPMAPQRTVFGEDARAEMCRVSVWFRYPL
jgi:hypothetical protein